ncbi:TIGR03960 family B12-binding radical SAM protein [Adlercreutzia sp. ZJ141]|uniref:TIGR03960 family B12-binding radical SAM protein n=1 Tax=Adlercreutzia sp. ZJ141 TaxID=2709406 RepID=UPI0013ECAF18|nr:TIGR03960 family B12-binding radical SAM protein [Adlercreutzia sp. ZJ141]
MELTNLWPRLEPLLADAERPARYLNHEFGCVLKSDADFNFCMVYPDTYELGQANQALRILVNCVNAQPGMAAQRAFLPAPHMCDVLRDEGIPLFSIEGCAPLAEFDAVGITLPHELAATNVLEVLDLSGIPLHASERTDTDPFVIAGGPCAYNPEPYAPFFDAFNIGEGERAMPEGLDVMRRMKAQGASRADILLALAQLEGWYVPSLYRWLDEAEAQERGSWIEPVRDGLPTVITKRLFEEFAESPGWEPCIVPFTEVVHDRLNVEVLRGCARGCRFCQAGMMYRPVRERSADNVVDSVLEGLRCTGYDEVSLTSLSSTDHSQIADILMRLNEACDGKGVRISVPSQRLDSFGVDMAELVAGQKKGGLTFAPEAGTQRLRDVINKNVTEDDLFSAIDAAFAAGWRRCKLYFMIGLPTETDDDIKGIASLAQRAYDRAKAAVPPEQRGSVRMSVSCALFVPKAQTPFQWDGQIAPEESLRRVALLRHSVKYRAVDVHWHDPDTSFIEAAMSRAGRDAAAWVEAAWRAGARFDAWSECFSRQAWEEACEQTGFDPAVVAQTTYPTDYVMPWSHISCGVSVRWLAHERKLAGLERTTPDCTFERCSACGACPSLGTDNQLAAPRTNAKSTAIKPDRNDSGATFNAGSASFEESGTVQPDTVPTCGGDMAEKAGSCMRADYGEGERYD